MEQTPTPDNTKNLFIKTYRRLKQFFPKNRNSENWEFCLRQCAEAILEDVYQDIVNKMCDQLDQIDVNRMDPITIQLEIPGEDSPKYLKVQITELDELLQQITGKLRACEIRPYRSYE